MFYNIEIFIRYSLNKLIVIARRSHPIAEQLKRIEN